MSYIYSHDMYKNELNQQNKGDENNEKICTGKPYISIYYIQGLPVQNNSFLKYFNKLRMQVMRFAPTECWVGRPVQLFIKEK